MDVTSFNVLVAIKNIIDLVDNNRNYNIQKIYIMTDYYINSDSSVNKDQIIGIGQPDQSMTDNTQHLHSPMKTNQQQRPSPYSKSRDDILRPYNLDVQDIFKRIFKYLLEGLAVALAAYYFTHSNLKNAILLGIIAALVFAILDTFAPTISISIKP